MKASSDIPSMAMNHFLILLSAKLAAKIMVPYVDLDVSHTLPRSESIPTKLQPVVWFIASVASNCSSGIP